MTYLGAFSKAAPPPDYPGLSIDFGDPVPPEPYVMPEAAEAAVEVAWLLGRPLLVTGAPGVGKTRLGWAVAQKLGLRRGYHFVTRSTSEAQDVFYSYDALRRYRDASGGGDGAEDVRRYVRFRALGAALLDAADPAETDRLAATGDWTRDPKATRSIVVIDEIDKASRDFANDVLVEVENMSFAVPELSQRRLPSPPPDRRPLVIVTSNAERDLPEAFLRRCVFLHLGYPGEAELKTILSRHLEEILGPGGGGADGAARRDDVSRLVRSLQAKDELRKKPGTAEAVDALRVMVAKDAAGAIIPRERALALAELTLAKTFEDLRIFRSEVQQLFGVTLKPDGAAGAQTRAAG